MKLITKYILKKCMINTAFLLISFSLVFAIFNMVMQLGDVGHGDFGISSMFIYIVALIPSYTYMMMPLSILIGVMTGMLSLVSFSEYAIIRSSGTSLKQIAVILGSLGIIYGGITFVIGDFVAPLCNEFAQIYKLTKTKQILSGELSSGIWLKDTESGFVNIQRITPENQILEIKAYYYDNKNGGFKLKEYIQAATGEYDNHNKAWVLHNVRKMLYSPDGKLQITNQGNSLWDTSFQPSFFKVLVAQPEDMSVFTLYHYIDSLRKNNQSHQRYSIAFWSKLIYPISCITMALIAIGFIPNNRRSVNIGSKLFAGILIGVGFFFLVKFISYLAFLLNWNPLLSSIVPLFILFSISFYLVFLKRES